MKRTNIKKLEEKGLLIQEEFSIYNPLNFPINFGKNRIFKEFDCQNNNNYNKERLFKEIDETTKYLFEKVVNK